MISIWPTTFEAFGSSIDGTQDGHTSIAIAVAPLWMALRTSEEL